MRPECAFGVSPLGGYSESLKGKGMAELNSTRATVYNKAGVGVRKMEAARSVAALFFLIIMFVGILTLKYGWTDHGGLVRGEVPPRARGIIV